MIEIIGYQFVNLGKMHRFHQEAATTPNDCMGEGKRPVRPRGLTLCKDH